jgi:hypothetical protein
MQAELQEFKDEVPVSILPLPHQPLQPTICCSSRYPRVPPTVMVCGPDELVTLPAPAYIAQPHLARSLFLLLL